MRDHTQPGALPLRPLTTGEVLDAAVVLFRTQARTLITVGWVLAFVEQAVLFPLRRLADVDASFLPGNGLLVQFGVLAVVGLGTEALCIGLLGGAASARAPRALLGAAAPVRPRRTASLTVGVVAAATLCAASGWAFLVILEPLQATGPVLALLVTAIVWAPVYGLVGLVAPAVVIDGLGPGRAVLRSVRLASRTGLRAAMIRVLGYLSWLLVRLALAYSAIAVVDLFFTSPSSTVDNILMGGAWLIVNTIAYPILGCLDAALHLDVRMRTEGLDIALRRSLHRGVAADLALAVPRRQPAGQTA